MCWATSIVPIPAAGRGPKVVRKDYSVHLRQHPRKDGSETTPNLEEEVVPDLAAISGTRASSEMISGTEVNL